MQCMTHLCRQKSMYKNSTNIEHSSAGWCYRQSWVVAYSTIKTLHVAHCSLFTTYRRMSLFFANSYMRKEPYFSCLFGPSEQLTTLLHHLEPQYHWRDHQKNNLFSSPSWTGATSNNLLPHYLIEGFNQLRSWEKSTLRVTKTWHTMQEVWWIRKCPWTSSSEEKWKPRKMKP